jgi:hypothetical protein
MTGPAKESLCLLSRTIPVGMTASWLEAVTIGAKSRMACLCPSLTLSSSALLAFLLAMELSAQASPLIECPKVHTDGRKYGALTGADLFQGPPEKKASMIPDLETWRYSWFVTITA